jgi:hypothetical protein
MTQLAELLLQKNVIKKKILELQDILYNTQTDILANELVELLEQKQSILINIHRANTASKLNIGGTKVDIATAVIIRDSIFEKITYLTDLIQNKDCSLDKLELMKQRDKYFEEHILISMGIQKNDLNVILE